MCFRDFGRVEQRIMVRLYTQFCREKFNTDWYSTPEEQSENFQEWMWETLAGQLSDVQVEGINALEWTLRDMNYVSPEKAAKLLDRQTSSSTRKSFLGKRPNPATMEKAAILEGLGISNQPVGWG